MFDLLSLVHLKQISSAINYILPIDATAAVSGIQDC